MPISPEDILEVARKLSKEDAEPAHRSSVSRAYYCAYHLALQYEDTLPAVGDEQGARGSHERLINRLRNPSKQCDDGQAKTSRKIGTALDGLKSRRVDAEYMILRGSVDSVTAQQAVADAGRLLRTVKAIAAEA